MTSLREVNFGFNQFCGPAVLSVLTGESTDRCAAVITSISGKKEIKAVNRNDLRAALKKLRFDVEDTNFTGSSLYGTLYRMHTHDGLYVIFVPHHVIAIEIKENEIYICDNHTKFPLDIKQSARLSQRVEAVWKVTAKKPPVFVRTSIKAERIGNKIEIYSYNSYENPEDNTKGYSGSFRFMDKYELEEIIKSLVKLGEEDDQS